MVKSMELADYIIFQSNKLGHPVTKLNISNSMYICNMKMLYSSNKMLIEDEEAEYLSNGVVYPRVYREYQNCGSNEIKRPCVHVYINSDYTATVEKFDPTYVRLMEKERQLVDKAIENFVNHDRHQLVEAVKAYRKDK